MKRRLPIILIILIFLVGLGILSYPLVSSMINNYFDRSEAHDRMVAAEGMPKEEIQQFFEDAENYNRSLTDTVVLTDPFDMESYEKIGAHYDETFDIDGNGFIGYIEIPKINVFLPIYHGTDDEVLQKGAGHLHNTSLPIGGDSTHSVISAHSALPSKTLFDYLPDLEEGDEFHIYVLDRTLTYRVDQIKTVLPSEIDDLYVVSGKDLVTLMTCTPYTVNTHRLLVRGERVADDDGKTEEKAETETKPSDKKIKSVSTGNDNFFFLGYKVSYLAAILSIAGFLLAVGLTVFFIVRRNIRRAKKDGE